MTRVALVRHPPVARAWSGRCYGRSDMGWRREGLAIARDVVAAVAAAPVSLVVHSGLRRTERLARMIAARTGAPLSRDPRWQERDFGSWEGRRWDAIWRETGDLMDRMLTDPHGFRPGGGETTAELADRAQRAWRDLPAGDGIVVVAHGGPIAAVRALLAGRSPDAIIDLVPPCGAIVAVAR